jgi:hypothetical protein
MSLTHPAQQNVSFTTHWHNLLKLHQNYFKIVTKRRDALPVCVTTTLNNPCNELKATFILHAIHNESLDNVITCDKYASDYVERRVTQ